MVKARGCQAEDHKAAPDQAATRCEELGGRHESKLAPDRFHLESGDHLTRDRGIVLVLAGLTFDRYMRNYRCGMPKTEPTRFLHVPIPESLLKQINVAAATEGVSVKQLVIETLQKRTAAAGGKGGTK